MQHYLSIILCKNREYLDYSFIKCRNVSSREIIKRKYCLTDLVTP
jgi:hypothetical protein